MSPRMKAPVRCAIVGFGGMARNHANYINETEGMALVAAADTNPDRLQVAKEQVPGIDTYESTEEMLKNPDIDLCLLILPHNLHAQVAIQCLEAGKHVVVEKPMAITVDDCTRMIEAAEKADRVLTVFHNRRWDGDFMTIKDTVNDGMVGEVFHVELTMGGFRPHSKTWRGVKAQSGGAFYDWGVHVVDWLLNLVDSKVRTVSGQFQKKIWVDSTNEDHCEAYVRFQNGASALVTLSSMMATPKPRWYVLGTDGAITDSREGHINIFKRIDSHIGEFKIPYRDSQWGQYYPLLARHLLEDAPLPVTPQSARRAIGVIQMAEIASQTGQQQEVPYE